MEGKGRVLFLIKRLFLLPRRRGGSVVCGHNFDGHTKEFSVFFPPTAREQTPFCTASGKLCNREGRKPRNFFRSKFI